MRTVGLAEKKKRGCFYCLDYKSRHGKRVCIHEECPYHELDDFESYNDFIKSKPPLWAEFFEKLKPIKESEVEDEQAY